MSKAVVACLVFQTALSTGVFADDRHNAYLHEEATISRLSHGKVRKRSTYVWPTSISPLALGADERKAAAAYGFLTAQARFFNIPFDGGTNKNVIIFNDANAIEIFVKEKIQKSGMPKDHVDKYARDLKKMSSCETMVVPDDVGRIQSVFATNIHPYRTAQFTGCLQMMGLRAFGVYLKTDHFAAASDKDISSAYSFLLDIYRNADRQHPFASISPR